MRTDMTRPLLDEAEFDNRIGPRVYLLYLLCEMADILLNNLKNVLTFYGENFKASKLSLFNEFFGYIRKADLVYDKFVPKDIEEAIDKNWRKLDGTREDANEAIRLLMYWADRTERNTPLAEAVMKMLKDAPEGRRYPEKVIGMFMMGRN